MRWFRAKVDLVREFVRVGHRVEGEMKGELLTHGLDASNQAEGEVAGPEALGNRRGDPLPNSCPTFAIVFVPLPQARCPAASFPRDERILEDSHGANSHN